MLWLLSFRTVLVWLLFPLSVAVAKQSSSKTQQDLQESPPKANKASRDVSGPVDGSLPPELRLCCYWRYVGGRAFWPSMFTIIFPFAGRVESKDSVDVLSPHLSTGWFLYAQTVHFPLQLALCWAALSWLLCLSPPLDIFFFLSFCFLFGKGTAFRWLKRQTDVDV